MKSYQLDVWEDDLTEGPYGCPAAYRNRQERKKDTSILAKFQPQKDQLTAKLAINLQVPVEDVKAMTVAKFITKSSSMICEHVQGVSMVQEWTDDELELMQFLMRERRLLDYDEDHRKLTVTKQMTHLFADLTALVTGNSTRPQMR